MGKLPVNLKFGYREFSDDLLIYSDVDRVLISWKGCKSLGILPNCYPYPPVGTTADSFKAFRSPPINAISANVTTPLLTKDSVVTEFPTEFDGMIRAMDGKQFHIHLLNNA